MGGRRGKRIAIALAALTLIALASVPAAPAADAGRKPSAAPTVSPGQHYSGQLDDNVDHANYGTHYSVDLWRLPALISHDVVTVDWHVAPDSGGRFPVCLVLAENVDDFNWGSRFGEVGAGDFCTEEGPVYRVAGSGTARTAITAQQASANSTYLEFFAEAYNESAPYATYPYDFTVGSIQHYISLTFLPVPSIATTTPLAATATLTTGAPVPDGTLFNLVASWETPVNEATHQRIYTAPSSSGQIVFPLNLPASAGNKTVSFTVSRPPDSQYQGVSTGTVEIPVEKVTAAASGNCAKARRKVRRVARRRKRLAHLAHRARGAKRRRLHRRTRRLRRKLRGARKRARRACATA